MNYNKLFNLAKEKGISAISITKSKSSELSFGLFHGETVNYVVSQSSDYVARGIYHDKFGAATTECDNKNTPKFIVDEIISSAKVIEKDEKAEIFQGSKSYKKRNFYNKELENLPITIKMDNLHKIEEALKKADKRVSEIEGVDYSESYSESEIRNSYGLKLKYKSNYYIYSASVVVKENDEVKEGSYLFFSNDPKEFNIDEFVKKVIDDGISKLNGIVCKAKKYKTVLAPRAVASLLNVYINWTSADEIQKHSSRLEGKLHQQIANKKLTVTETPLAKNIFGRGFDDEGVATYNKKIIDKGVLSTYLYNLETARKDHTNSTGNGYGSMKISVAFNNLVVKPGKKSEEEMMKNIKEGVYITSVTGLHAGMNRQSGNFSLQAEGFMIKDGKKDKPLKLITCAGNLYDLFNDIQCIANNHELLISAVDTPSILIKKLAITAA